MRIMDMQQLAQGLIQGNRRSLARLITGVESRHPKIAEAMAVAYEHTGNAKVIGITGPPGAGKSTLTNKLIYEFRQQGKKVGVVAVDPSSPFSGGALLGDRVRMYQHASDPDVFIRSLGTRGAYGGLSRATGEIVHLMDAAGFDIVLVETVGVGQTELDIMDLAGSVIVVLVPESGDVVQTMKAGLTEIADIFVVNKADRGGADSLVRELDSMVDLAPPSDWRIPVVTAQAVHGIGIDGIMEQLTAHEEFLTTHPTRGEKMANLRLARFLDILAGILRDHLVEGADSDDPIGRVIREVRSGQLNPYAAATRISKDQQLWSALFEHTKD